MSLTPHLIQLASNASVTSGAFKWPGGKGLFEAGATFGGGSVALQYQGTDATWRTPTNGSLTAAGEFVFELPPCQIRVAITTATAVYASASRIP